MTDDVPDRSVVAVAAAAIGVYLLVLAGATTTIVDAVAACSGWPTCGAGSPLDDPAVAIAWAHRSLAVVAGGLVVWAAVAAWPTGDRRVRGLLAAAVALYPVQVGLGARIAVTGGEAGVAPVHLLLAMAIFVGLVAALAILGRGAGADHRTVGPAPPEPTPGGGARAEPSPGVAGPLATARAYLRLTKPRLMWLLCLVAAAGMALAAGPALTLRTVLATLGGGVLAIGASGTFNHVLERDLDRTMRRTADRPLATDQVGVRRAAAFGVVLAVGAVALFASINPLAAALGLAAIAYYSVVYTLLLKPNTVQNTVIGGLAGSFPALIGAAAATRTVGLPALVLGLVIFLWTPAHFYNLALLYRDDYERGGIPMFPVVRGEATTRTHILGWLGATLLATAGLAAVAGLGPLFSATAAVFGAGFLLAVVDLHRRPSRATAWRSFHASNAFLGAILLAVVLDALVI